MMNTYKSFYRLYGPLVLIALLYSCHRETAQQLDPPETSIFPHWDLREEIIIPLPEENFINYSAVFDSSYQVVRLETNDQSLIGEIDRIDQVDTTLLILDRKKTGVFIFHQDGRFIGKIVCLGKGPLELSTITDFSYNPKFHRIDVFDFAKKKMLYFDMQGQAIGEMDFPYHLREFACDLEGNYIVLDPDLKNQSGEIAIPTSLFWVDPKGNFVDTLMQLPRPEDFILHLHCLSGYGEKITFAYPYDASIYQVVDQRLQKVLQIQHDDWPHSFYSITSHGDLHSLFFSDLNGTGLFGVFNSQTGTRHASRYFFNDLFYTMFRQMPTSVYQNTFTFISTAESLIHNYEGNKALAGHYPADLDPEVVQRHKQFNEDVIHSLDPEDNPVLVVFRMKK